MLTMILLTFHPRQMSLKIEPFRVLVQFGHLDRTITWQLSGGASLPLQNCYLRLQLLVFEIPPKDCSYSTLSIFHLTYHVNQSIHLA